MSGTSQTSRRSPEGVEQAASTLYVVTGLPDDTREVAPEHRGYDLACHALRWQDRWSRDYHRSWWSSVLTWPATKGGAGCVFPMGHRGGSRESLAHSVAFAIYMGGFGVDDALALMGVARSAGHRSDIRSLALAYADCFAIIDGRLPASEPYREGDRRAVAHRLPIVVTDADYSGFEWLTGRSTLPYTGVSAGYRTEALSVEAFARGVQVVAHLAETAGSRSGR
jgi:hypothetical protein